MEEPEGSCAHQSCWSASATRGAWVANCGEEGDGVVGARLAISGVRAGGGAALATSTDGAVGALAPSPKKALASLALSCPLPPWGRGEDEGISMMGAGFTGAATISG